MFHARKELLMILEVLALNVRNAEIMKLSAVQIAAPMLPSINVRNADSPDQIKGEF